MIKRGKTNKPKLERILKLWLKKKPSECVWLFFSSREKSGLLNE